MQNSNEPWFNAFSARRDHDEPDYFQPGDFEWVKTLENEWTTIRAELDSLIRNSSDSLVPYYDEGMVSRPEDWKVFPFYYWGWKIWKNCRRCPETVRILKSIPHLTTGAFSILEPNTTVNPHVGDTNAVIRCHLGLVVPEPFPVCGLKVDEQARGWEEGKLIMFCDAKTHSAWNHSDRRRVVLFVDVMRPEFAKQRARVCRVMRLDVALKFMAVKLPFFARFQPLLKRLLFPVMNARWF